MAVNYLELLDIQRWTLREVPETAGQSISDVSEASEIAAQRPKPGHDEISDVIQFSAYTSVSVRRGKQRWLWVIDQPKLSIDEVRLLDKILDATQSHWETIGLADSYLHYAQIQKILQEPLFCVVLMGGDDHLELFNESNILKVPSLTELMNEPEKKRQVWASLKGLMK